MVHRGSCASRIGVSRLTNVPVRGTLVAGTLLAQFQMHP